MIKINNYQHQFKRHIPEPSVKKEKEKFISGKVKKIMNEGIRGKKVSDKEAVAVAYSMAKKK